MKIKFELEPDEMFTNIKAACALIDCGNLGVKDLREVATYIMTFCNFKQKPRIGHNFALDDRA